MKYAFDTTDEQEDAITYKRLKLNVELEKAGQPTYDDNASYVAFFVATAIIGPLIVEFVESKLQKVADAYRAATDTDRKTVEGTLKVG